MFVRHEFGKGLPVCMNDGTRGLVFGKYVLKQSLFLQFCLVAQICKKNMKFYDQLQAISLFNKTAVLAAFANPDEMS